MKRITALLLICFMVLPLFSSLSIEGDMSDDLREKLTSCTEKALGDRRELDVLISDVREDDDAISFTVSYDGKSKEIETNREYLEKDIKSLFYYEESLFEEGARLDYIYNNSFSSVTAGKARRGTNWAVIGTSGKTEALLRTTEVYDGVIVMRPYFLSNPLPGMRVKRINDFSLSLKAFSTLTLKRYGASLSLSLSSVCYPIIPFIQGAVLRNAYGVFSYYGLVGISASFNLSSVWPDIPVIRNISFSGEAAFGGVYSTSLTYGAEWAFDCTYTFSRIFSLSLGLVNYSGVNYYSLTLGGKL